jgi:hypothetical protein
MTASCKVLVDALLIKPKAMIYSPGVIEKKVAKRSMVKVKLTCPKY